ncbi:aminotransferase class IV [Polyangium jinanense]|uniref:branched-chain-amino-acid transaminase n=1 Tax=Polyangium jinanense TaxID=2829994 RepID=A0A9X3WYB7_9BACT|nr:aminotransferase class IV [Polyangium jinanense]MDC3952944.1 aminotransferase class IV [Polyangium jinanense]MDC3980562.1 aminotransferase class IV [Polyangium jinanense]
MSRIACIDGRLHAPEDAKVSVYDRGFLYGDSVFETIRTYRGRPFALDEHVQRLERSAAQVAIPMPIDRAAFAAEIEHALAAAANPESYVRATLTRGSGPLGLDPRLATHPLRVILVEQLVLLPAAMYRDGVAVITHRTERACDAAHGAKVGNYLASVLAIRKACDVGAHEALIINTAGQIVEGTTSNVFVVRGRTLITPPEEAGILAGITRAHILAIAGEAGLSVELRPLVPDDVRTADEVFLSSSLRELLPVVAVDGAPIGSGKPGPNTRALHLAFRRHVGMGDAKAPWEG